MSSVSVMKTQRRAQASLPLLLLLLRLLFPLGKVILRLFILAVGRFSIVSERFETKGNSDFVGFLERD
jgi:hypothetical protein